MAWQQWFVFAVAVTGLALTPGPNGLLALTHGALYGHRRALFTVSGGVLGFVLIIALSMFGIGALLLASAHALTVLKWVGGAYLVWLGIQLWRAPALKLSQGEASPDRSSLALFGQGLMTAIANPKVILFFGAFLAQFIDSQRALLPQFAVMAATFSVVEFLVEYLLVRLAHQIRPWLERSGKRFNQSCGGVFVLVGAVLPMTR